jgi:O-antigen/teichoic acid export membrane protein
MNTTEIPERFGRNTASSIVLSVVFVAVAVVTTPLLTHHLGHVRYGIWVLVASVVQYLELLEVGFAGATVIYIARHYAAGEDSALERTVNTSFFALSGLGVVALGVAFGIAAVLPQLVHVPHSLVGQTRTLVVLLGLDIAVSVPMDTFGGGLVALQRFDQLNATLIAVAIARAVAWTIVLLLNGGLVLLGIVTVSIGLIGQFARLVMLRRLLPNLSIRPRLFDRATLKTLARPAGWFAVGSSAESFRSYAVVLILGVVRNVAAAGVYSVGQNLATFGFKVQGPATQQFYPHAAALVGRADSSRLSDATITGSRISAGATIPFCLVVAVFARPALIAWVGTSFTSAATATVLLASAYALDSLATIPRQILRGSGRQRIPALISLAGAITEVGLAAVLGFEFGLTGVGAGVLIGVVFINLGSVPYLCRRLGLGTRELLGPLVKSHLPPVLVAGAVGVYLSVGPVSHFVATHGRFADIGILVVAGLVVLAVYVAIFARTGLDHDERGRVIARLRRAT